MFKAHNMFKVHNNMFKVHNNISQPLLSLTPPTLLSSPPPHPPRLSTHPLSTPLPAPPLPPPPSSSSSSCRGSSSFQVQAYLDYFEKTADIPLWYAMAL